MRSSSPTPGCFGFLRKSKKASKSKSKSKSESESEPKSKSTAPVAIDKTCKCAPTPTGPPPPRPHEHYDPCVCSNALSRVLDLKANDDLPPYEAQATTFSSEIRKTVRDAIASYTPKLTPLSLWISEHPELAFNEFGAVKRITALLEDEGFDVERNYKGLETSFKASFSTGAGRTFAFNSEYDALPLIGHACGHNLICVAGIAALLGVRAAMKEHGIKGTVTLIGTPAEEGGGGKALLLERGGYKGVDGCMMIHPGGLPDGSGGVGVVSPTLAIQTIDVEFHGRTAHAAGAPWNGINALDAANIAYTAVSALRQQIHPTDRVHGIIVKGGEAPNGVIPDYTSMKFYVRGQNAKGVADLMAKVKDIFEAAAKATGCTVKYKTDKLLYDLRNNLQMSEEFASAMADTKHPVGIALRDFTNTGGSTDFGNVTYALPACHPHYAIPSDPGHSNHTREFAARARAPEAHEITYAFAGGMACVGARFLQDKEFADEAKKWWQEDMKDAGGA